MPDSSSEEDTHSVPLLEGRESRRHEGRSFADLRAEAATYAGSATAPDLTGVRTLVQFAGFPRSGHSVVGSLIDAHPDAVVAHELDLMGLVEQGFDRSELFWSVCRSSAEFERHGRWWNGYCYRVEGGSGGASARPVVLGDKKGDWAVRRIHDDPTLLDRLGETLGDVRPVWVVVVRNPFDNIATMSLRKGRRYDRIRINAGSSHQFRRRLERQQGSTVSAAVLPEMVEDYAALCDGVTRMQQRVPADDWLELRHEDLVAAPESTLRRLFGFLDLPLGQSLLRGAATTVSAAVNRTRHQVTWSPEALQRVHRLVGEYSFLEGYSVDD